MTKPRARVLNATAQQIAAISAVEDIRFWEKTRVEGDCLVWTGYRDRDGYGTVFRKSVAPSPVLTHRYAYYLANGPYGDGQIIRHSCDNPPCVLPAHRNAHLDEPFAIDPDAWERYLDIMVAHDNARKPVPR